MTSIMNAGQNGDANRANDKSSARGRASSQESKFEECAKKASRQRRSQGPSQQRHLEPAASLPPLSSAAVQDIDHVTRWRLEPRHRGLPTRGASPARKELAWILCAPSLVSASPTPGRTKFPGFSALFCRSTEFRVVGGTPGLCPRRRS